MATPSIWGAGLALLVGGFLDPKAKVAYATPSEDGPTLAPQIEDLVRGKRVLLVDNIIRSGETMTRFDELVERLGGEVIGIATLWNLAGPEIAGHAVFGLLNSDYEVYRDGDCPLCIAGSKPEQLRIVAARRVCARHLLIRHGMLFPYRPLDSRM